MRGGRATRLNDASQNDLCVHDSDIDHSVSLRLLQELIDLERSIYVQLLRWRIRTHYQVRHPGDSASVLSPVHRTNRPPVRTGAYRPWLEAAGMAAGGGERAAVFAVVIILAEIFHHFVNQIQQCGDSERFLQESMERRTVDLGRFSGR